MDGNLKRIGQDTFIAVWCITAIVVAGYFAEIIIDIIRKLV